MEYKVYEMEDKVTPNGKTLKKLVLQGTGKQYPDKNVTMWADHPLFEDLVIGQKIDVELDVKESTTPNPHGGFYKNKTVIGPRGAAKPSQTPKMPATDTLESRSMNALTLKVLPLLEAIHGRLGLLMKAQGIKVDDAKIEYPEHTPTAFDEIDLTDKPPF